jgi:NADH-quinone oxidoreductase subunit M
VNAVRQLDVKRIVAYSSIAHMNLVVLGMFSYTYPGLSGSLQLMLAHGFVSGALFMAIGVLYDRLSFSPRKSLWGFSTSNATLRGFFSIF